MGDTSKIHVSMRERHGGAVRSVELDYAVLHVIARGTRELSGFKARDLLLAGATLSTREHDFFWAEAVARKQAS